MRYEPGQSRVDRHIMAAAAIAVVLSLSLPSVAVSSVTLQDHYRVKSAAYPIECDNVRLAVELRCDSVFACLESLFLNHAVLDAADTTQFFPHGVIILPLISTVTFDSALSDLLSDRSILRAMPCYVVAPDSVPVYLDFGVSVEFEDGIGLHDAEEIVGQYGLYLSDSSSYDPGLWGCRFRDSGFVDPVAVSNALSDQSGVEWAAPQWFVQISPDAVPSDEYFGEQYYLQDTVDAHVDLDAVYAWEVALLDSSIIIALLDDGFTPHHDLPSERWLPGFDWAGDSLNEYESINDPPDSNATPGQNRNHGMACAGIIGASHENGGIAGVIGSCRLLPRKIYHNNTTDGITADTLGEAIREAYARGAKVIANSWTIKARVPHSFVRLWRTCCG